MELLGMAYLANDRQGSKIVVASGEEGVAQPPEEQRVVSHDPSVRSPRVRQSLLFVSLRARTHTHTHGEGGNVNPARLPKFNAPLVFGRRVSATARASADAALAPRIRFLLLLFIRQILSSSLSLLFRGARFSFNRALPVLLHPTGSRFFLIFPLAFLCFL